MLQSNALYTKDDCSSKIDKISYELFLDSSLILLGFGFSNTGTILFRELIKTLFIEKSEIINLNDYYSKLSLKYNTPSSNVSSNIKATFRRIDINLSKQNFKKVFGIDYNDLFITPKNLIVLFLNTLNRSY